MELRSDTIGIEPTITVVHVSGELNAETCDSFFAGMVNEIERSHVNIIIDCGNLSFVSSLGLATLLRAYSRIKKHDGTLKFAGVQSKVADLFQARPPRGTFHDLPNGR